MLAIGLCDDNYDARLALRSALERLLETQGQRARLLEFSSGEGLLGWLDKHPGELNLIFLDMEMGDLNGMDTARRLRQRDETLPLVFVSRYPDHVFEGYQVGALAYLLKPPTPQQLEDVLTRAAAALLRSEDQVYLCRRGEITYLQAEGPVLAFQRTCGKETVLVALNAGAEVQELSLPWPARDLLTGEVFPAPGGRRMAASLPPRTGRVLLPIAIRL